MRTPLRIPESELIINSDGSVFHLHIKPEQLADNIIMVGDPDRVIMISSLLSDIECRNANREFVSVTGYYNGKRITVLSHGIGPDNIDIVMTELDALANVDFKTRLVKLHHRTLNILRIGTSGALHADIPLGSFVLSHMSVGFDGVMNWYGNREKVTIPAVEDAFKRHMNWDPSLPSPYFVKASPKIVDLFRDVTIKGVTISAPGFYGPQGRVVRVPLAMPNMLEDIERFRFSDAGAPGPRSLHRVLHHSQPLPPQFQPGLQSERPPAGGNSAYAHEFAVSLTHLALYRSGAHPPSGACRLLLLV